MCPTKSVATSALAGATSPKKDLVAGTVPAATSGSRPATTPWTPSASRLKAYSGCAGKLTHLDFLRQRGHGRLLLPGYWKSPVPGVSYALDNGAFAAWRKGQPFPEEGFLKLLARPTPDNPPDFVVCPDKVAGGLDSLRFSQIWRGRVSALGYDWMPWYLAVQDGMDGASVVDELATGRWAGLFIGGTMRWKYATAEDWVRIAHKRGLKVHIGRTPQVDDLVWAERIGADSCDSTSWARNDRHFVLDSAQRQVLLSGRTWT